MDGTDPTAATFYSAQGFDFLGGMFAYWDPGCSSSSVSTVPRELSAALSRRKWSTMPSEDYLATNPYPSTTWEQFGDIVKARANQIADELSKRLGGDPQALQLCVFGSQVTGRFGATPDLDVHFDHPAFASMGRRERGELVKDVREQFQFAADIGHMDSEFLPRHGVVRNLPLSE